MWLSTSGPHVGDCFSHLYLLSFYFGVALFVEYRWLLASVYMDDERCGSCRLLRECVALDLESRGRGEVKGE